MQPIAEPTEASAAPAIGQTAPRAIRDWFLRLSDAGHPSHLLGECVLQLALGIRPNHYLAHSPISRDALLALAPRAIPTGNSPATITVPTSAGPLDVIPDRCLAQTVAALESAPFGVLALALDPLSGNVIAQHQSKADIATGTLSPTGKVPTRDDSTRNGAVFALEAARLLAIYGLTPSPSLLDTARKCPIEVSPKRRSRVRLLVREMLMAPDVRAGLTFLRNSGAEALLVPGVRADAAAIVANVPAEPRVRFCAWLQNADAKVLLRGLYFGGGFSSSLYRLLELHPIDQSVHPEHSAGLRRLVKRLSPAEIADLLALRVAEAQVLRESGKPGDAQVLLDRLEHLEQRFARARETQQQRRSRTRLALSGAQIMQVLGCGPGSKVGAAIRHLERAVAADPDANTREALLRALDQWRAVL